MAEEKKTRRATALKRDEQSLERNAKNRSYKAKVSTAIRSLKDASKQKKTTELPLKLNAVFSLMDKGVKTGVFKQNKASRVKSQLSQLVKTPS